MANKAKAPFKRNTALIVHDPNVNGGNETEARYVKWMGFERSALIVVEVNKVRLTVNVSNVRERGVTVQEWVDEALDTAVFENGYRELMSWGADAVVVDLMDLCPELEPPKNERRKRKQFEASVKAHVIDYQLWYARTKGKSPRLTKTGKRKK